MIRKATLTLQVGLIGEVFLPLPVTKNERTIAHRLKITAVAARLPKHQITNENKLLPPVVGKKSAANVLIPVTGPAVIAREVVKVVIVPRPNEDVTETGPLVHPENQLTRQCLS